MGSGAAGSWVAAARLGVGAALSGVAGVGGAGGATGAANSQVRRFRMPGAPGTIGTPRVPYSDDSVVDCGRQTRNGKHIGGGCGQGQAEY